MSGATVGQACPKPIEIIDEAAIVLMGIRGLSDLMLNMEKEDDLHAVRPENLQVLLDLLADKLEAAIRLLK